MALELTRLTHKIAIQLHLVVESCIIYSFRSRRPVRKLLDTPWYMYISPLCFWLALNTICYFALDTLTILLFTNSTLRNTTVYPKVSGLS